MYATSPDVYSVFVLSNFNIQLWFIANSFEVLYTEDEARARVLINHYNEGDELLETHSL